MNKTGQKHFWVITGIILLGALLRATYLITPAISSDQATFGLQGIHVLKGEFPVFSWGFAYIGTLQSYLDAVMFYLFGVSRTVLNGTVLLFYIAYGYSLYYLSKSIFKDFFWQAICVLLGAVAPAYFMIHGAWARHGYPETYLFGTLIMAVVCNELQKPTRLRTYVIVSFIAGLAWWTNFLVIYYFPPLALFFVIKILSEKGLANKVKIFSAGLISSIAGSLPFWIHNLRNNFDSLSMFNKEPESSFFEKFSVTFSQVIPILLGTEDVENNYHAFLVLKVIFLLLAFVLIFFFFYEGALFFKNIFSKKVTPRSLLWLFLLSMISIYMMNSSQANGSNARYLIPFYTLYPLIFVSFLQLLISHYRLRVSSLVFLSAILCTNFHSFWSGSPLFHKEIRTSYRNEMKNEMQFFKALEKTGKKNYLMSEYWKAYRFTFDAREELIFDYIDSRYPPYLYNIFQSNDFSYLLSGKNAGFENGFRCLGFDFRKEERPPYVIYTDFLKKFADTMTIMPSEEVSVSIGNRDKNEWIGLDDDQIFSRLPLSSDCDNPTPVLFQFSYAVDLGGIAVLAEKEHPFIKKLKIIDAEKKEVVFESKDFCTGRVYAGKPFLKYNSDYFEIFFSPAKVTAIEMTLSTPPLQPPIAIRQLFFFKKRPASEQILSAPELLKILKDSQNLDIFCSPGTAQTVLDTLGKKAAFSTHGIIDFGKIVLLISENEFLDHNRKFIEGHGLTCVAERGEDFSIIKTTSARNIRAVWLDKFLLPYRNKKLSKKYFILGQKAYLAQKVDEAVSHLNDSFYYLNTNMASLSLLNKIYSQSGNTEKAAVLQNKIHELTKRTLSFQAVYDRRFRLNGLYLEKDTFFPSEKIELTYLFECLKYTKNDFSVFVHFTTPDGKILFQGDHFLDSYIPGNDFFIRGEYLRDSQAVKIPQDCGYSGKVQIWLGLLDPKKDRRFKSETRLPDKSNRVKIAEINLAAR
jgi:hypothetical protein